jgi:hypothetical protein
LEKQYWNLVEGSGCSMKYVPITDEIEKCNHRGIGEKRNYGKKRMDMRKKTKDYS